MGIERLRRRVEILSINFSLSGAFYVFTQFICADLCKRANMHMLVHIDSGRV